MMLRQLLDWYDRDEASDDELERIIAQARGLVEQSDAADQAESEYVLYDFDSDRLLSTEVYARYADAAADAAGLDDVLILRLQLPSKANEVSDED
jgi:hypothetical protein